MSLEEKFEALIKNFWAVSSTIEELKQKLEESEGQSKKIDPKHNRINSRAMKWD